MLANPALCGKRVTQWVRFGSVDVLSFATVPTQKSSLEFQERNHG
jgi:hypothetical protein